MENRWNLQTQKHYSNCDAFRWMLDALLWLFFLWNLKPREDYWFHEIKPVHQIMLINMRRLGNLTCTSLDELQIFINCGDRTQVCCLILRWNFTDWENFTFDLNWTKTNYLYITCNDEICTSYKWDEILEEMSSSYKWRTRIWAANCTTTCHETFHEYLRQLIRLNHLFLEDIVKKCYFSGTIFHLIS